MFNRKKGFTLIELLVVIAIIGILATIVLVNLNAARNKANDAAVKGALSEGRAAAEMFYDGAGNGLYTGLCADGDIVRIGTNVKTNNGNVDMTCAAAASTYCLQSVLKGGGNWCVDNTGFSGTPAVLCSLTSIGCN